MVNEFRDFIFECLEHLKGIKSIEQSTMILQRDCFIKDARNTGKLFTLSPLGLSRKSNITCDITSLWLLYLKQIQYHTT